MKRGVYEDLNRLRASIDAVVKDRDAMRDYLASNPRVQATESEVTQVLHDALENKEGWRERARSVLGLTRQIACDECGTLFPSGGKRSMYCSEECRKIANKRR